MYRPRGNGSIYINFDRLITPDVTERTQAADILRQIIQGAKRGDYTRLAIMDTFHDFTAGTKKGNWSVPAASQGVTKLKRVMKEAAPQEEAFINLFNSYIHMSTFLTVGDSVLPGSAELLTILTKAQLLR